MKVDLAAIKNSKYAFAVGFLVAIFCVNDFFQRVRLSEHDKGKEASVISIERSSELSSISREYKQSLVAQFEKYDSKRRAENEQVEEKVAEISEVDVNVGDQQGALLDLYTRTSKLNLKAVITTNIPFAVIKKTDRQNKESNWLKLRRGNSFDGFVVQKIDHTSVTLARGEQVIELLMYKRN